MESEDRRCGSEGQEVKIAVECSWWEKSRADDDVEGLAAARWGLASPAWPARLEVGGRSCGQVTCRSELIYGGALYTSY